MGTRAPRSRRRCRTRWSRRCRPSTMSGAGRPAYGCCSTCTIRSRAAEPDARSTGRRRPIWRRGGKSFSPADSRRRTWRMRSPASGRLVSTSRRALNARPASKITSACGRCSRLYMTLVTSRRDPDARGYFGEFGGRYVPETLVEPIEQLERAYFSARDDPAFQAELSRLLTQYVGRATPVFEARRLAAEAGGARLFLKREDLTHTGAHKINNAIGQGLLAARMGKQRIIAETGAGQHGVASATVCALLGLDCIVYMGAEDVRRQEPNVLRMRLLGAEVRVVESGSRTLKDAINEALRDWVANARETYYLLGSALGPHPYPLMVRDFQSVIGDETRRQFRARERRLP